MILNGFSEFFAFKRPDESSFLPVEMSLKIDRSELSFQDANNINAMHAGLIVRSRPKLLHIFEETDKRSHFVYRELTGIIFT